jgi:hypothetical protein
MGTGDLGEDGDETEVCINVFDGPSPRHCAQPNITNPKTTGKFRIES